MGFRKQNQSQYKITGLYRQRALTTNSVACCLLLTRMASCTCVLNLALLSAECPSACVVAPWRLRKDSLADTSTAHCVTDTTITCARRRACAVHVSLSNAAIGWRKNPSFIKSRRRRGSLRSPVGHVQRPLRCRRIRTRDALSLASVDW